MSIFITELPADKYGNRLYTNNQAHVIEVEPISEYSWKVIAPDEFKAKWPTIRQWADQWQEVSGPARLLSRAEYKALIGENDHGH
jgi:hypothetical protein